MCNKDTNVVDHLLPILAVEGKIEAITCFAWIYFSPGYSPQIEQTCYSP